VFSNLIFLSGGFILVCFLGYLVWRGIKRSKRKRGGSGGGFLGRFASRLPFLRQRTWQNLDDSITGKSSPPSYRENASRVGIPQSEGFYRPEKVRQVSQPEPQPAPQPLGAHPPKSVDLFAAVKRPMEQTDVRGPQTQTLNLNGVSSASTTGSTHQTQESFSSTAPMEFGTMLTSTDGTDTLRSGMGPGVFYNQSQMARQPSRAYDPARRQVNRTSALSSISSGFGDGDIVVGAPHLAPPMPAMTAVSESSNYSKRFSWMSQSQSQGRRDTIYTQSSEDMPPRFRSLNSWVDQQTGRIKRAQQKENEDGPAPPVPQLPGQPGVPGIHNPPNEPSFIMMMMDDEQPRRVDDYSTMSTTRQ